MICILTWDLLLLLLLLLLGLAGASLKYSALLVVLRYCNHRTSVCNKKEMRMSDKISLKNNCNGIDGCWMDETNNEVNSMIACSVLI